MAAVLIPINGSVLAWAIREAGLTDTEVATRLGVPVTTVKSWVAGAAEPNKTNFDRLIRLLDRPESFFFLASPPPPSASTARFRGSAGGARVHEPSPDDLKAVKLAQSLQRVSRWLAETSDKHAFVPPAALKDQPEAVADRMRAWLSWSTTDQIKATEFEVPKLLRERIEANGVVALNVTLSEGGFRGFSLPDMVAPILAINTRDDTRARTFSYAHECSHLMLGDESICDVVPGSQVERWCDAVAGAFLMPGPTLRTYVAQQFGEVSVSTFEQVRRAANRFSVSLRAMAYRLELIGLAAQGLYQLIDQVASKESRRGFAVGGPRQTRARVRLQRYGRGYVGRLIDAEQAGDLDPADLIDILSLSRADLKELRKIYSEGASE
ncbi:XRE family transcriptional regulator [Paractinoplanes globisporus]|uniref:ImmA/IrrE family metallo-endopeptidase n=1 Tax=Paractinoplanes globisporus TaxID=113565 RepID=A0ABW6WKY1_9ACTN|nr:XRE family transcriptional regulator [Actinoplanes globisporus]